MSNDRAPYRIRPEDAERYAVLRRRMLEESAWAFMSSPEEDRGCDPAQTRASLAGPCFEIMAIEGEGGRLLAAAGVRREDRAKRRHIASIWGVYVEPAARGSGLGRRVVESAIEVARGWEGVEVVQLCVVESVAPPAKSGARLLYESLGFEAWGTEPDAMRVGGKSYRDTHMYLRL
ncbi:MAG: N-acetyltransferase family protein [Phycisphaerales bacterium]